METVTLPVRAIASTHCPLTVTNTIFGIPGKEVVSLELSKIQIAYPK